VSERVVAIDVFPESVERYPGHAFVVCDVIRATTTAVTAVAQGRDVYPVPSLEAALPLAARLSNPLLVGELGGNMPYGFDLTNSPADVAARDDVDRPMILLSTSGTRLLGEAGPGAYAGSLRNYTALARFLAQHHKRVAVIGAGTRGEFREEDQLACSWIAEQLVSLGFEPANDDTRGYIERWSGRPVDAITMSNSVEYLRRTGQLRDLDFVLTHIDDVDVAVQLRDGRLVAESVPR
jgi:2-phosphosulfolactate phosphatase